MYSTFIITFACFIVSTQSESLPYINFLQTGNPYISKHVSLKHSPIVYKHSGRYTYPASTFPLTRTTYPIGTQPISIAFSNPFYPQVFGPAIPTIRETVPRGDDTSEEFDTEQTHSSRPSTQPTHLSSQTNKPCVSCHKKPIVRLNGPQYSLTSPWEDKHQAISRRDFTDQLGYHQYGRFNLPNVTVFQTGSLNSLDFKLFFQNDDGPISPFHDIPLFANEGNKIFNMVVEVPRWSNAKMEIATKEPLNPIKQDVKKGKLRYVANVFPHHGYIWNYGALPQTWEDPSHVDAATGCKGDNDPIDVCEIGYRVAQRGEVLQVKVLGTLAMIDEGETDWKLIAIDVNDPLAPQLSDISDVEKHMPGFLKATVEWFKIYKMPDGKPENQFAFNAEPKDRAFAHNVILETHDAWKALVAGISDAGELNTSSVTVETAANKMTPAEAEEIVRSSTVPGPAQPIDPKVDTWHYITLK